MATDKFQLVGSLLRPQDLLDYKNQIEHREDIRYPFYDAFPGYQETEAKRSLTSLQRKRTRHHSHYRRRTRSLDVASGFSLGIKRR